VHRDAMSKAEQQWPMENEEEPTQDPQRDQRAATPISPSQTPLAMSLHGELTLPAEGKAQIRPLDEPWGRPARDFIVAGEPSPRHACPTRK